MNTTKISESVTAIVCAFNEEKTLSGVVRTLIDAKVVNELVVINDGSTDGTSTTLKEFANNPKVRVIEYPHNCGKGFAMAEGIDNAQGEILLFVDADLLNFELHYISQLLNPLMNGEADMVIGHPTENDFDKKINPFISIAGERAIFKKDILPIKENIKYSGYGVETIINLYYASQNKSTKYVWLWGLLHPIKLYKHSFNTAFKNYWREGYQVSRSIVVNYTLIYLIIRNTFGKIL